MQALLQQRRRRLCEDESGRREASAEGMGHCRPLAMLLAVRHSVRNGKCGQRRERRWSVVVDASHSLLSPFFQRFHVRHVSMASIK